MNHLFFRNFLNNLLLWALHFQKDIIQNSRIRSQRLHYLDQNFSDTDGFLNSVFLLEK